MSDTVQVKVDNWGIFFLQRLKNFFNRTDYCDLTLQFQDNAQLKVHRLVLNACTEHFEYLERMCEMYEDCLIMPDDLQADVVVPIVNFMYTGQLDYKPDLLEKLYQTAQIMNMTILTKLLDAQRNPNQDAPKEVSTPNNNHSYRSKRSYTKAFESSSNQGNQKKVYIPNKKPYLKSESLLKPSAGPSQVSRAPSIPAPSPQISKKSRTPTSKVGPTRYEVPEELEPDVFDDSFSNISYESKPLMVHPQAKKTSGKTGFKLFCESTGSKKIADFKRMILDPSCPSTIDVVECKKISTKNETLFDEDNYMNDYDDVFDNQPVEEPVKDTNQLFDEMLDDGPKLMFETKSLKEGSNIDHAKIISEVLKKYPHLMKSNKNIKLKIVNASSKQNPESKTVTRSRTSSAPYNETREIVVKNEQVKQDFTYETDVIDSKEAARLIAMGAENITGPWICLICGTPGKALHFTSYYKYRRHLVEVHREKPIVTICEHCGLRSTKRNYMLHHMYTKHNISPPPPYKFPKCNQCPYIALTEAFLIKHKLTHVEAKSINCNVCFAAFKTPSLLLRHMQNSGHKISAERKPNLQCIYCLKVFLRESNLYAHLKIYHKLEARSDGIIDNSDEEGENKIEISQKTVPITYEPPELTEDDSNDTQYQIQQKSDDDIQILMRSPRTKQKILNQGLRTLDKNMTSQKLKTILPNSRLEFLDEDIENDSQSGTTLEDEVVMINKNEFIIRDQLQNNNTSQNKEYIVPDVTMPEGKQPKIEPSTSEDFAATTSQQVIQQPKMFLKKPSNINQPIQIVVSNEEEYKALMASNPSIIFDGTSAAIDLNNPQTNDVMILQQDYPLNVSEAVQTDNSNIVVVYSHPVDDQNKQYLMNAHFGQPQLITSQALGTQFVSSSAVLTQNFETITTSSSMVGGQVLVQQPIETWPGNIQQNIVDPRVQITTDSLQQLATQQAHMLPEVSLSTNQTSVVNTIAQLPDIQLVSQDQSVVITSASEQPSVHQAEIVESTVIVTTNNEQHLQETNDLTMTQIETNGILQQEVEQGNIVQTEVLISEASNAENMSEMEGSSIEIEQSSNEPDQPILNMTDAADEITQTLVDTSEENITETGINKNALEVNDEISSAANNSEGQNISFESKVEEMPLTQENCENVQNITAPVEKVVEIQNLTSEWSEDEEDKTASDNYANENVKETNLHVTNTLNINEKVEVEESIENIQQEMEKQMMEASGTTLTESDSEDKEGESTQVPQISTKGMSRSGKVVGMQEKISSLLNDWEENDSQEENEENVIDESHQIAESTVLETEEENVETAPRPDKVKSSNDGIKSLVSDWDDDDKDD